jgi:hypothetical protein
MVRHATTKPNTKKTVMKLNKAVTGVSLALALAFAADTVMAQDGERRQRGPGQQAGPGGERGGRGNFDPAEMQRRIAERVREQLEITDDAEWRAIEPLITKVSEARMATLAGRMGGRGGPGGGGFGGQQQAAPETEALQRAIDAKASNAEMKTALNKYVEARKAKQTELETAQATLRKVLTPRQEAIATLNGLL